MRADSKVLVSRVKVPCNFTATAGNLLRASNVAFRSLHFVDGFEQPVMAKLAFRACYAAVSLMRLMYLGRNSITSQGVSHRFEIEDITDYLGEEYCTVDGFTV